MRWFFKKLSAKVSKDRLQIYSGRLGTEIYWPKVLIQTKGTACLGLFFPTMFVIRRGYEWEWKWAVALQVLGIGFGFSWDHCENPFRLERRCVR